MLSNSAKSNPVSQTKNWAVFLAIWFILFPALKKGIKNNVVMSLM